MQLSYAQRLEDFHLDLAFGAQATGTYVDIGAGHPVADNVSYWFYLKGWNGLVVEPQRAILDLYGHLRPRDIAVCCLVGDREGDADFHVVERLHGFSTTIADHARMAAQFGARFETVRMPMRTLSSLLAEHDIQSIDFLKVDVEGAEAAVLAGMDWRTYRPRIVLVEATTPGSMAEAWREWEPLLLEKGYRFVLYDDLNRFYVAEEETELAQRLPRTPVSWDSAQHLYDCGRALDQPDHPDHQLARELTKAFLAALPTLDSSLLADLLSARPGMRSLEAEAMMGLLFGSAEFPGPQPQPPAEGDSLARLRELVASDRFRAALGRIAAAYDGGHIMD